MHTEHLHNKCMITHNTFDYAQLGLTIARLASQLKPGFCMDCTISFGGFHGDYYKVGIFKNAETEEGLSSCIKSFWSCEFASVRDLLDSVLAFCIENDLFKQPLDIKLVD